MENKSNPPTRLAAVEDYGQTPNKQTESINFFLATCNVRTLKSENKMLELKQALSKINWDDVGVSEVRIFGESIIEQVDGALFSYVGKTKGLYGVGFLIKKQWKTNIVEIKNFTERITLLKMKINKTTISIVQVYAPTANANTHEIEAFYTQLDNAMNYTSGDIRVVMGDFNSRLGQQCPGEETIMGSNCYGIRNLAGERLIQWIWQRKLSVCNTLFNKKSNRKWTWRSPNSEFFEIDYVLINNRNVVMDLEVLNNFEFDTDHRLVRAKLKMNHQTLRKFKSSKINFKNISEENKYTYLTNIRQNKAVLECCQNVSLQSQYDRFEKSLKSASTLLKTTKSPRFSKLTSTTISLIGRRTQLLKKTMRSTEEQTELRNLRRQINQSKQADIENFNTRYVTEILTSSKSISKANSMVNPDKHKCYKQKRY